jgi:ribonuclease HI
MNVSIETLARSIITQIISDIGQMENSAQVKFSITKTQKWQIASDWLEMTKTKLNDALVKNSPYTAGFDGSAKPNPGEMTIGGWIKDPDGNKIYTFTETLGQGTNNEAEYLALIKLFEEINKRGIRKIHIQGDSALVVNQVKGSWKTKDPRMDAMRARVYNLTQGIEYFIEHVIRKYNSEADSLTR